MEYVDNYPTCAQTSVTLRVFADDVAPQEITKIIEIEPSEAHVKGQPKYKRRSDIINKTNGWFLRSDDKVESKDFRRHLDWLIQQLNSRHAALRELTAKGAQIDIFCPWASKTNEGGPIIDPRQMKVLGELNVELVFEFWYGGEDA